MDKVKSKNYTNNNIIINILGEYRFDTRYIEINKEDLPNRKSKMESPGLWIQYNDDELFSGYLSNDCLMGIVRPLDPVQVIGLIMSNNKSVLEANLDKIHYYKNDFDLTAELIRSLFCSKNIGEVVN